MPPHPLAYCRACSIAEKVNFAKYLCPISEKSGAVVWLPYCAGCTADLIASNPTPNHVKSFFATSCRGNIPTINLHTDAGLNLFINPEEVVHYMRDELVVSAEDLQALEWADSSVIQTLISNEVAENLREDIHRVTASLIFPRLKEAWVHATITPDEGL